MEESEDAYLTPEDFTEARKILAEMEKLAVGPEEEAQLFKNLNAQFQAMGVTDPDMPVFYAVEDFRNHLDRLEARMEDVRKFDLFYEKHADVDRDDVTDEELAEYIKDMRWMKPIISRLYGEDSDYYKFMMEILAKDDELLAEEAALDEEE